MKEYFSPIVSKLLIGVCSLLYLSSFSYSQNNNPVISIPYNSTEILVDGDLDEWEDFFSYQFSDTLTAFNETPLFRFEQVFPGLFKKSDFNLPRSKNKVIFTAFWNSLYLNIALRIQDHHLYSEVAVFGVKPQLNMNDGIEIYIDSKDDSYKKMDINDYQFLVDVKNNSAVYRGDRLLMKVDTLSVPKDFDQNVFFKHAVKYSGSVNNDEDLDNYYVIEIEIPFAAIGMEPEEGNKLKLDVCNNDVDYHTDESCIREYMSVCAFPFNWSGYSDFGYPKFWKKAILTGSPGFFELLSKKYGHLWFTIYLITFLISLLIVFLLSLRIKKLRELPSKADVEHAAIVFVPTDGISNLTLSSNQQFLKKATEFIISRKDKNVHSEDVAKEIAISLRTFQRITKEELNCTPTNFINLVKLKLAAEFLSKHAGNVTDAAYEYGFSDPSYFSKLFKKHFGHSPSEHPKSNDKN